jgi:hypothetical protein
MLSPLLLWRIGDVSVILMAGTFWLFLRSLGQGARIEQARAVAVNTLVFFEIFDLLTSRHITADWSTWVRIISAAASVLFIYELEKWLTRQPRKTTVQTPSATSQRACRR